MKPIPPGYSEAADNAPIPGRPWWVGERGQWRRSDGVEVVAVTTNHIFGRPKHVETYIVADAEDVSAVATCAAYDAAHPLPHPGYRAGQVWLCPDGSTTTLLCVGGADPVGFDPLVWKYAEDGDTVTILNLTGCWLLHDPLMPSRAPWGPA